MENLKPCPFCGTSDSLFHGAVSDPSGYSVWCNSSAGLNGCCGMVGPMQPDEDSAIAAWNTRPSPARDEGAGTMGRGEEGPPYDIIAYRIIPTDDQGGEGA